MGQNPYSLSRQKCLPHGQVLGANIFNDPVVKDSPEIDVLMFK